MTQKHPPISYTHSFCFTLESRKVDFVSQTAMLILKKSLTNGCKPNSPKHSKHQRSVLNLWKRLCAMNSPGLPVHALHPEFLPARVQQQHLLLDLKLFFGWQISLGYQLVSSLQNIAHTALVRSQFHHKILEIVQADTLLWGPIGVYDLVNILKKLSRLKQCCRMSWHHQMHEDGRHVPFLDTRSSMHYKNSGSNKTEKKADHLNERSVWEKTVFKQTHQEYEIETYLWPTEHKTRSEMCCRKAIRTLWVRNIYLL